MAGSGKELVVPPRRRGRPSVYTEAIADEIIERLIEGENLTRICDTHEDGSLRDKGTFPAHTTVEDWARPEDTSYRPDFSRRFARARLGLQTRLSDEMLNIADTPLPGIEEVIEHSEKNGITIRRARKDMLHHRVLQIETRRKYLSQINPALWAERLQQPAPPENDPSREPPRIIIKGGLPDEEDSPPPPPQTDLGTE